MVTLKLRLMAITDTGRETHLVALAEVGDERVNVLTLCNKLVPARMLFDASANVCTCGWCKAALHKNGYNSTL